MKNQSLLQQVSKMRSTVLVLIIGLSAVKSITVKRGTILGDSNGFELGFVGGIMDIAQHIPVSVQLPEIQKVQVPVPKQILVPTVEEIAVPIIGGGFNGIGGGLGASGYGNVQTFIQKVAVPVKVPVVQKVLVPVPKLIPVPYPVVQKVAVPVPVAGIGVLQGGMW